MAAQELSEPTIEEDGSDIIDNIREQPDRSEGQERKPPTSWFNRQRTRAQDLRHALRLSLCAFESSKLRP